MLADHPSDRGLTYRHRFATVVFIRRDGCLAAVVGIFPIEWHVGSTTLRMAGIGGVCTDPQRRGQGLMSRLMRHVVDAVRADGYDLSYLGGQRQKSRPRWKTFQSCWKLSRRRAIRKLSRLREAEAIAAGRG